MGMSRSEQMARMKGKDTTPERRLRSMLWVRGLRYRLHAKTPGGRPDIVFPGARVAVFIDGCFWHGCPVHYVRPRTRHEFWAEKLAANVERDRRQTTRLEDAGWTVIRLWEHEVDDDAATVAGQIGSVVWGGTYEKTMSWRVYRVDSIDAATDQERRHLVDLRNAMLRRYEDGGRYSRSGRGNVYR